MKIPDYNTPVARRELYAAVVLMVVAFSARWHRLSDGLWLDEMTTVVDYVATPWPRTVAAEPGQYVANNHVLNTLLVKAAYATFADESAPFDERIVRLPAMVAGCLLPVAVAWPTRRAYPVFSVMVGLLIAVHPWLIVFSTEARGYSLMLLLGVLATNCLQSRAVSARSSKTGPTRPGSVAYPIVLAAAIYTVPLAILILPAHLLIARRRIIVPAAIGLGLAALLYLPQAKAIVQYYRHPYPPTLTYSQFLDQLPRFSLAGDRVPIDHSPGPIFWALPVLTILGGSILLWSRPFVRPLLITLGSTTLIGILLPAISPTTAEVRFVPWIAPLWCLCVVGVLTAAPNKPMRLAAAVIGAVVVAMTIRFDLALRPTQPIRELMRLADRTVPADREIVVAYVGGRESIALYGGGFDHRITPGLTTAQFVDAVAAARRRTGRRPWVLIYFPQSAAARDWDPDYHGLWSAIDRFYKPALSLPSRIDHPVLMKPVDESAGSPSLEEIEPQRHGGTEKAM